MNALARIALSKDCAVCVCTLRECAYGKQTRTTLSGFARFGGDAAKIKKAEE
jgi:hypothetical protein